MGAINFAKDDDYYTPKAIVDYFGDFDYDPATTKERAEIFGIENYDTIETNGLLSDWTKYKKIWLNPPFSCKAQFLQKAVLAAKKGGYIYMLFPVSYICTKEFNKIIGAINYKLYVPNGRIKFEHADGKTSSPAFGSIILELGPTIASKEIITMDLDRLCRYGHIHQR